MHWGLLVEKKKNKKCEIEEVKKNFEIKILRHFKIVLLKIQEIF